MLSQPEEVNNPLVVVGSRSFANNDFDQLVNKLNKHYPVLDYFQKGSALKFFDLALGKADIYPRFAPTMEWDIAAGHAILNGLGGEVFEIETGKPLRYNKENLRNPFFIAKTYPVILD
jgi:3'(2'), 5'-bisphosphate nucleotidase